MQSEIENAWKKFEQSGKVADYIAYTAGMLDASQNVKQSAMKTALDVSAQVNIPSSMVTGDMSNANKDKGLHIETT